MGMNMCPKCRKELPPDSKICSICGQDVSLYERVFCKECSGELVRCPKCGKPAGADANLCGNCGYDLKSARRAICFCCDKKSLPEKSNVIVSCKRCGHHLKNSESFCPICGTPVNRNRRCVKCNTELLPEHNFCPVCGRDANASSHGIMLRRRNSKGTRKIVLTKKKMIIAGLLLIIFIFGGFSWKKWIAPMFVPTDKWLAEGNFERAYDKAGEDEKQDVLIENLIIDLCNREIDYMNDSDSFNIRRGWIDVKNGNLVLLIGGKNSFGGSVINMWVFTYSSEQRKYISVGSYSDLEGEEINPWDDTDDMIEKLADNIGKIIATSTAKAENQIKKEIIKNINSLHKRKMLDSIDLLDEVKTIYPRKNES